MKFSATYYQYKDGKDFEKTVSITAHSRDWALTKFFNMYGKNNDVTLLVMTKSK